MSLVECVPSSTSPSRPVGGLAVHPSSLAPLALSAVLSFVLSSMVCSTSYLLDGNVLFITLYIMLASE